MTVEDASDEEIHADSGNRLPPVVREELDEAGKKAFDATMSNRRTIAGLRGPAGLRLYSPRSRELEYLRYETALGRRLTELAILVTAREMDSQFEWTLHEEEAKHEGLEEEVIDIVRLRRPAEGLAEKETSIIRLGRELFATHSLSRGLYDEALRLFGAKTLVDLVCLMGNYAGTAVLLAAFNQQLAPGVEPRLPMP